jgi:hypothetical protein
MSATRRVGLLHTVPIVAGDFERSVTNSAQGVLTEHVAHPWLLAEAIRSGVTEEVTSRVIAACRYLVDGGAQAVLVTCSSIGEAAEAADAALPIPVLRVDAPMARDAVRLAREAAARTGAVGRITVLATLESTLGPTGRLIERMIADGQRDGTATDQPSSASVSVTPAVCPSAFELRAAGDAVGHDRAVAAAVAAAVASSDVIVLAQASMASAVAGGEAFDVPILTSPASGVAGLIDALGRCGYDST